jgi:hypothetical protein
MRGNLTLLERGRLPSMRVTRTRKDQVADRPSLLFSGLSRGLTTGSGPAGRQHNCFGLLPHASKSRRMKESCSRSKGPHTFMSLKASCSLKSPQLGPIRCQSGRGLLDHPGCWLPDSMPGVEAFNRRCGSIPQGSSKHPSHGQIVSTSQRRAVQVDEFSGHGVAQFFFNSKMRRASSSSSV